MSFPEMRLGLPQPEDPITDINSMRQAMERGSRDSSLINSVLNHARYAGLSGEDKYAMLAYEALLQLERQWRMNMDTLRLSPMPPLMFKADGELPDRPL